MDKTGNHGYFGTESEFIFIDELGAWSNVGIGAEMLLKKYIEAANKRVYWGNINRRDAILYAMRKLEAMTNEPGL